MQMLLSVVLGAWAMCQTPSVTKDEATRDTGASTYPKVELHELTFRASTSLAVAGFLVPGDRVDIYWGDGVVFQRPIYHGLSVVSHEPPEDWSGRYAEVMVTLKMEKRVAEKLARAERNGRLYLYLTIPECP
ncbi:MAG: hypothetical protein AAF230_04600 [Pseudomonadota bacterium]